MSRHGSTFGQNSAARLFFILSQLSTYRILRYTCMMKAPRHHSAHGWWDFTVDNVRKKTFERKNRIFWTAFYIQVIKSNWKCVFICFNSANINYLVWWELLTIQAADTHCISEGIATTAESSENFSVAQKHSLCSFWSYSYVTLQWGPVYSIRNHLKCKIFGGMTRFLIFQNKCVYILQRSELSSLSFCWPLGPLLRSPHLITSRSERPPPSPISHHPGLVCNSQLSQSTRLSYRCSTTLLS